MAPTFGNGRICYLILPAADPAISADFYAKVFHWNVRKRGDGSLAFDDGVGEVSGTWTTDRKPVEGGMALYIMVDDARAACDAIAANGGTIVQPIDPNAREITALFRDPGGNILGVYEERG